MLSYEREDRKEIFMQNDEKCPLRNDPAYNGYIPVKTLISVCDIIIDNVSRN